MSRWKWSCRQKLNFIWLFKIVQTLQVYLVALTSCYLIVLKKERKKKKQVDCVCGREKVSESKFRFTGRSWGELLSVLFSIPGYRCKSLQNKQGGAWFVSILLTTKYEMNMIKKFEPSLSYFVHVPVSVSGLYAENLYLSKYWLLLWIFVLNTCGFFCILTN